MCLLQKRPQDLPASTLLFSVTLLSYALISSVLAFPTQRSIAALMSGILETLLLLGITWIFLYLRSVPERLLQTCTALAGTGFMFSLFALPMFYWGLFLPDGPDTQATISLLVLILVIWNITVMTHILRNALSSSYLLGVTGSVAYIALITFVLQTVFPVEGGI